MRITSVIGLASLAVLLAAPLALADNDPAKLADSDIQLLAHFHAMNQTEIDLGQIAQKQAHSRAVKDYAKQIVDDHKANDRELIAFARKHSVKIPKPSGDADAKDVRDLAVRLKSMKGADFDREYLLVMVADHDGAVASADAEVQKAMSHDLAQMIRDMKPVLQRHADMARDIQKTIAQPSAPAGTAPIAPPSTAP